MLAPLLFSNCCLFYRYFYYCQHLSITFLSKILSIAYFLITQFRIQNISD
nr:MAG TPA: hypothetical protein [Caudoviricetes sp.]